MDNTYEGLIDYIKRLFKRHSTTYFEVGHYLKMLLQSRLYVSYYSNFKSCVQTVFNMSEVQVYNYIAVYDRFNNVTEYSEYSFSQLLELVYVPDSEIQALGITLQMTVREIRKLVRPSKPQPLKIGLSSEEKKESEKEELLEEIQKIRRSIDYDVACQDVEGAFEVVFERVAAVVHRHYEKKK